VLGYLQRLETLCLTSPPLGDTCHTAQFYYSEVGEPMNTTNSIGAWRVQTTIQKRTTLTGLVTKRHT